MANLPFDQRIIHPLERPSASDLNIALSQVSTTIRTSMRYMLERSVGAFSDGALIDGFQPAIGGTPGMNFYLRPGLLTGSSGLGGEFNIGSIPGVNNILFPYLAYLYTSKEITVPDKPAAGLCRRDFVYVRPLRGDEHLINNVSTDIFNTATGTFSGESKPKTMTSALDDVTPTVLAYAGPFDGATAIVYVRGSTVPYVNDDSFLSSVNGSSVSAGYVLVAIVNLKSDTTTITNANLVDARKMLAPYGHLTLVGEADVGATGSGAGTYLDNVSIEAPPSLRASIYKLGADQATKTNSYVLAVFGPQNVTSAVANIAVGRPVENNPLYPFPDTTYYPASVMTWEPLLNQTVDAEHAALYANSSKVTPTQAVAVGQKVHYFPFTVGRITTEFTSQTVAVNLSSTGAITIPNPTETTFPVTSTDVFRQYQMVWDVTPGIPTDGLPSGLNPTWAMRAIGTEAGGDIWQKANVTGPNWRVAGFVTDASDPNLAILPGTTWKLSVWSSWANYGGDDGSPYLRAAVYLYDGVTNPELGSAIATSDRVALAQGIYNVTPSQARPYENVLSFQFDSRTVDPTSRLYIRLYLEVPDAQTVTDTYLFFNNEYPCILSTSLPTTSSVTLDNYPAGTYPVAGTAGTITVSLPGYPTFDPSATIFARHALVSNGTIPVRFTVNMVV